MKGVVLVVMQVVGGAAVQSSNFPPTRLEWLSCRRLSFRDRIGKNHLWDSMRSDLQQHVRLVLNEDWPEQTRVARKAQLKDVFSSGWNLFELESGAKSMFWPFAGAGMMCSDMSCAQCAIGEVTLQASVLLSMSQNVASEVFSQFLGGPGLTITNVMQTFVANIFTKLDRLLFVSSWDLSFQDVLESGWPLFAVLAAVSTLMYGSKFLMDANQPLASVQGALIQDLHTDLMTLLRPQNMEEELMAYHDTEEAALNRWIAIWQSDDQLCDAPKVLAHALLVHAVQRAGNTGLVTYEYHLQTLQQRVQNCRETEISLLDLFAWPWPLFETLDRLQLTSQVTVQIQPSPLGTRYGWHSTSTAASVMFVPRARRPSTYGFIGDYIRGTASPHCGVVFRNALDTLMETLPFDIPVHIFDIGSMLGDCCLWVVQRARMVGRPRIRCTAFEPNMLWAELIAGTIEINGLAGVMDLRSTSVGPNGVGALDSLFQHHVSSRSNDIIVLKVHTDGRELDILAGAQLLFQAGMIHLAIVRAESTKDSTSGVQRQGFEYTNLWLSRTGMTCNYTTFPAHGEEVIMRTTAVASNGGPWLSTAGVLLQRNLDFTGTP